MGKVFRTVNVTFGNDPNTVCIADSSRSTPIIATVLGSDCNHAGEPIRLYLDCKIHTLADEGVTQGWSMHGAISTILVKADAEEKI